MTDWEKVVKGLELREYQEGMPQCDSCPYDGKQCWKRLKNDALALLKAQEPRVMTPEELIGIYVEFKNDFIPMSLALFDLVKIIVCAQEGSCRLWTSKPSDEQREATPWA